MISPVLFEFAGFEIRWYSVLILIGVIIAYFLVMSESKRFHYEYEFTFNLIFWGLIMGIIGARVYYVLFNLTGESGYLNNPSEILKVWHGGLAIHGGLLFGVITIIIYTKMHKKSVLKVLDICAPAVILAQAIGRWGNFFNREAFGSIVEYKTLVNMKIIPQFVVDNMYIDNNYHLPMFYFESLLCVLGFIIMIILRRKNYLKNGQIVGFYLIWYGLIRFFIEAFRTDSLMFMNFKVAQIVSVLMILTGIIINIIQMRKPKLEELYDKID